MLSRHRFIYICSFFCTDPAPTVIYTYLHPLPLPDALPICKVSSMILQRTRIAVTAKSPNGVTDGDTLPSGGGLLLDVASARAAWNGAQVELRSEEHTSELQSLMRNSYADFCLKNTNKDTRH